MPLELRVDTDLSRRLHVCAATLTALCEPGVPHALHAPSVLDILIIDDDRDTRVLLDHVCTAAGYRVDHAPDGASGLTMALAGWPRLVLLDVHLPALDGRAVARHLQTLPQPPIILLMTGDPRVLPDDCIPFSVVAKPFDLDALVTQIVLLLSAVAADRGTRCHRPLW